MCANYVPTNHHYHLKFNKEITTAADVTEQLGAEEERKDTDMALEIVAQASSHQLIGLLLLSQTVEG